MLYKLKLLLGTKFPKMYKAVKKIYYFFIKRVGEEKKEKINAKVQGDAHIGKNSIVENILKGSARLNKVLIIGRIKEGDSIGSITRAFLNSVDYDAYEIFLYDEYAHSLYLYKSKNISEFVKKCFAPELDASFFDMLIYLNVLDNGTEDYPFLYRVPKNPAFLSFACPIFDGTVPPKDWVNILNTYFDGVFVACNNLKKIFEKAGVVKPIFELPISLDLRAYLEGSRMPNERDEFVFGWIGTFEDRKNPFKIIQAFREAFDGNQKVKLKMHTRFVDTTTEAGKQFEECCKNLPDNIIISEGVKTDQEVIDLMNSFDSYIYVSRGEGYSITPRQAMACGLSLVLSAIPTHKDITELKEKDGVFWVRADKEIDAVQPSLNNQICGKMFDIEIEDLKKVLIELYNNRNNVNSEKNVKLRQKEVLRYDDINQMFNYRQIILPNEVRQSKRNIICQDGIETNDIDLIVKYKYYLENEKRKVVICPAHDGGFCSVFNKWMSHLVYMPENTILIPDWRIKNLKAEVLKEFGRSEFTSFCYGNEKDGNIFFKCFENPYRGLAPDELFETSIMYQVADITLKMGDFNEKNEPNLTYINSYNLYDDEKYFPIFRNKYNHYLRKYVKLVPELQARIDDFCKEKLEGKFVISAHIRSAAHTSELLDGDRPTWELYEKHVLNILEKNGIFKESDKWRLFIASDNNQSIAHFEEVFKGHVVSQTMNRLTEADDAEYKVAAKKAGKDIEGFGLQHRAASDEAKWSIKNAYEILFDVYVLAKGEYYIFVNSNISTMVSYVNPEIEMVYCR